MTPTKEWTVASLLARVAQLEQALEPFAAIADRIPSWRVDDSLPIEIAGGVVPIRAFREAKRVLAECGG